MRPERLVSRGFSRFLRTRLAPAGAAVALALAVSTCGGDSGVEPASVIAFAVQPSNTVAGAPVNPGTGIRVEIRGTSGTIVTSYTGNVTLAITTNTGTGGAVLSGTKTVPAVNGVATFNNLSINRSGNGYRLTASSGTLAPATSGLFDIATGAMSKLAFTVPPGPVTAGSAMVPAVEVTALDALDNTVTGFVGSVTVAITAGTGAAGATLSGATPVNAVAGVASFPGLSIDKSAAGYTLTASTAGPPVATVISTPFPVNPGPATRLTFTADPNNATAGVAIAPPITVTAFDAQNNVATNFPGPVTLAITAGTGTAGATLGGTVEVGPVNGVATFGNVNIDRVGTGYTLTASSGALTPGVSASFDIAAGPPAQLAFTVQPSPVTAGAMIAPAVVVEARDAAGNVTPSFTGDVTIAIANNAGPGGVLTGTATVTAVAGVATFADLSIDKSGVGYTLSATSGALAGTSAAFNVVAGAATTLAFTAQPTNVAAGAAIAPPVQVWALDALGNVDLTYTGDVTVALAGGTTGATLGGDLTVAAVAGVATFADLTVDSVGTGYTLTATAVGLTDDVSAPFAITAGPAATIEFSVEPSSAVAGVAISPAVVVTARDAQGNVATFSGDVTLVISAGTGTTGATLGGNTTVAAVAGVATFADLTVDSAGTGYSLTASTAGVTDVVSATFDIAAGAAAQLVFTVEPTDAVAGVAISPSVVVTARDALGNTATSFTDDVTVALTGGTAGATLGGDVMVAAVAGVATFGNLTVDSAGAGYTLTATSGALSDGVSAAFDITAGAATKLVFTVPPSTASAGIAIAPAVQVTAQDALGNTDLTFAGDVALTISGGTGTAGATLSGTTTIAAVAGVANFNNLSIDSVGTGYTLTATATGLTDGVSTAFNIMAGPPATIEFSAQPSAAVAGVAINPAVAVTARDAQGNVATDFTGNVTLAISAGTGTAGATLSGTLTQAAVAGVATFADLSIDSVGTGYTLTAATTSVTDVVSTAFDIAAGPATQLTFIVDPTDEVAGVAITPAVVVTARDAQGNVATGFTGDVAVAITTGTGTAGAALSGGTPVAAVAGVATFANLSVDLAGTGYTLTATSGALTDGVSAAFDITPGTATKLAFTVPPSTAVSAVAIAPAVEVAAQDAFGNLDPTFIGDVTVAITGGSGTANANLSGTTTVAAAAGVATFNNLSIDSAGIGYTLTAAATGLTDGVSAAFNITPGPAATIVFTVEPSSAVAGVAITPAVAVTARDAQGNVATGFTGDVSVALSGGTAAASLGGDVTVAAVAGVATFADLTVDSAGTDYTLTASTAGLADVVSAAFDITAGAATQLTFTTEPTSAEAGVAISPPVVVTARDAVGNVDLTYTGDVTLAITNGSGTTGANLSGTTTAAAVAGVATFADLRIDSAGTAYTLTASGAGLADDVSAEFDITPGAATQLTFQVEPSAVLAGAAITPAVEVTARDAQGNVDPTFAGDVTVEITTGSGTTGAALAGTLTRAAAAGVATFDDLSIDLVGTAYTLTATATGLTDGLSAEFDVSSNVATQLAFTIEPVNAAAGAAIPSVEVTARDAQGNVATGFTGDVAVAITAGTGDVGAALSGTKTVAAVAGVATFANLSIDSVGTGYTLTATSGALTAAVSASFNIAAGAATQLAFTGQPTNAGAGVAINPAVVVVARDAGGNLATGFNGDVTVAITGGTGDVGATLLGTKTVAAVSGVATFSTLNVDSIGTGYTLTATSAPLTAATSTPFNITAGPAAALFFTGQPSTETVNSVITPAVVVTARDQFGNVATQYANNITVAILNNAGGGTLGGGVNRAAVNGVATFTNLTISAAGVGYTLSASSGTLTPATSAPFNIDAPVAVALAFTVDPTETEAGAFIPAIQVQARDASNSLVGTFTGPITLEISAGSGAPGATLTGTTTQIASGGIATFTGLSIDSAAGYTLTATSPGLSDGVSSFFRIVPGPAAQFVFTVPPSNAVVTPSVIAPQIEVTALDALGNIATGHTGQVNLAITPLTGTPGALLLGTTSRNAAAGVAAFPGLSIDSVGAGYTLNASDGSGLGVPTATSGAFEITAGASTHLQFFVQPQNTVAGATMPSVVVRRMLDPVTVDAAFNGPVSVAITAGSGTSGAELSGTKTVTAVNGVATFSDLSINRSGSGYRLSATAFGAAGALSSTFTINVGTPTQLDFLEQPVTTTAGEGIATFRVRVLDALGNRVTSYVGDVTVAISVNPGGGTLAGATTVAVVDGFASFTGLSIDKSGTGYRLEATSTGLTSDLSNAFTIRGGAPVRLAFTVQPTNTAAGANITPTVRVTGFDALDNIATFGVGESITLAITPGTGTLGAVLANGGPLVPSNGVAVFTGMNINLAGNNYTLTASSGALPTVVSTTFNINP